jgi:hypothetical protein
MDNYLKEKADSLLKSLYKNVNRLKHKKDAVEDVLDSNTTAEVSPDNIPKGRVGALNKSKMQKKQGVPEEADPETHERCVKKVKAKGHDKESAFAICNEVKAGQDVKKSEEIVSELMKNLDIISKACKSKMEKRCWEGYEPTPGKKAYSEGSCQIKKEEGKEKPFVGYNKEKHSKEGGLSAKAREKYNRETGSNLKAPVSSKEAKKSPKKAARRKSFCARMSGVKGATSKKGKLTPKGAALKRWDC